MARGRKECAPCKRDMLLTSLVGLGKNGVYGTAVLTLLASIELTSFQNLSSFDVFYSDA